MSECVPLVCRRPLACSPAPAEPPPCLLCLPQKQNLWQQLKDKFEPSVPSTTLVNDGSIFLALALWAAWQVHTRGGASCCFCIAEFAWCGAPARSACSVDTQMQIMAGVAGTGLDTC